MSCVLGPQKNLHTETVEYAQHMFWMRNKEIVFQYTLLSGGLIIIITILLKCDS